MVATRLRRGRLFSRCSGLVPFPRDSAPFSSRAFPALAPPRVVVGVRPALSLKAGSIEVNRFQVLINGVWVNVPTVVQTGAGFISIQDVTIAQVRRVRFGLTGPSIRTLNEAGGQLRSFSIPVPFGPPLNVLTRELPAATLFLQPTVSGP